MEGSGNYKRELGKSGEDQACRFLQSNGHRILARNWRSGHLEIDIISVDKDGIHFVEVKTRRKSVQAPPQDNVDYSKQARITRAALRFLSSRTGFIFGEHECSFDVIAITYEGEKERIEWIPQAFIPIYR